MGQQGTMSRSVKALTGDDASLDGLARLGYTHAMRLLSEALYPTMQNLDGDSTLALVLEAEEAVLGGTTAVAYPEELVIAVATRIAPAIECGDPEVAVCSSLAEAVTAASKALGHRPECVMCMAGEFGDEPDLAVRHMGRARRLAAWLIALWRM